MRVLARGIHPAVPTDSGLAPAIENLVDHASTTVDLSVTEERCSETCEATAYFVVSEALANVSRHARTTSAAIEIRREADDLVVSVSDGGVGGADPAHGSGLRGLSDRVVAVGGTLAIESLLGRGTQLIARIPCG